jgi:hypothetical protein
MYSFNREGSDMLFAGADPDLRVVSIAYVDNVGHLTGFFLYRYPSKDRGADRSELLNWGVHTAAFCRQPAILACVEYPQIRPDTPNRQSLVELSVIAGALAGNLDAKMVLPMEWKGSIPKHIHQARVYATQGWDFKQVKAQKGSGYAYPIGKAYQKSLNDSWTVIDGEILEAGVEKSLPNSIWKDLGDSLGLAVHAHCVYMTQTTAHPPGHLRYPTRQ